MYELIDKKVGDCFGDHRVLHRTDLVWYLGDNKFGIIDKNSEAVSAFMYPSFGQGDTMRLCPSKRVPFVRRTASASAYIGGEDAKEEIEGLMKMIEDNETACMYLSSIGPEVHPCILTFSVKAPSTEYYRAGKILMAWKDGFTQWLEENAVI